MEVSSPNVEDPPLFVKPRALHDGDGRGLPQAVQQGGGHVSKVDDVPSAPPSTGAKASGVVHLVVRARSKDLSDEVRGTRHALWWVQFLHVLIGSTHQEKSS